MNTKKTFKIVVGYDFTPQADAALELAVRALVEREHAEIHAVYSTVEKGSQAEIALEANQKEIANLLQKAVENFVGSVTLYAHLRSEPPAKAILKLAAEIEADAIFVGTHNRKGLSRLVLGSVAEQVVRLASCSVTVAKERSYILDKNDEVVLLEPPCEKCVAARAESNGEKWWCETHAKPYHAPHRYSYKNNDVAQTRSNNNPIY